MENYIVHLTEQQMKALDAFLNRITLQGSEVPAFNSLVQAFSRATPERPTEEAQ